MNRKHRLAWGGWMGYRVYSTQGVPWQLSIRAESRPFEPDPDDTGVGMAGHMSQKTHNQLLNHNRPQSS